MIFLDASELGGKWKASVNVLSLLRDLESYSSMVLAFRDLLFNVMVYMELKNIQCYYFVFLGFPSELLLFILFNLLYLQKCI